MTDKRSLRAVKEPTGRPNHGNQNLLRYLSCRLYSELSYCRNVRQIYFLKLKSREFLDIRRQTACKLIYKYAI